MRWKDIQKVSYYNGYKFKNNEIMKKITNGELVVDLFDKDGNWQAAKKLYIHNPKENIDVNLVEILENRIDMGVQEFFYPFGCL